MKLSAIILLCTCLQVSAKGLAQTITMAEKNAPLVKVFKAIEKQTSYVFFFDYAVLEKAHPVNLRVTNAMLKDVLDSCFKDQPITYTIVGKNIVVGIKDPTTQLVKKPELLLAEVKGRVTNEQGEPLPGASILIKGTKSGTRSDDNGDFSLTTEVNTKLVISYVGYESKEITVTNNAAPITIVLTASTTGTSEIVVIGYGTAKRKDLTGSVSQVKSADVTAFPTTNIIQALSGRASGVRIMQNNGAPGSSISVRIRGTNSILGGNEPLYVIDGFPFSGNPTFLQNGDIESIEVLKDASSIAIYGSRGANGVVIITTKSGKKGGKTIVTFDAGYTMQQVSKKMKLLTPSQYAEIYNEQAANDGVAAYFTQQQIDSFKTTPGVDWQDLVMRKAPMFVTNVGVNGGNEKTRYSLSAGVFNQEGIIRNSDYNRYSIRANITHDISKIFSVSYNATLTRITSSRKNNDRGNRGSDIYSGMLLAPPTLSPYLSDGSYRRMTTAYSFISNALNNPMVAINEQSDNIKGDRVFTNAALTIKPVSGLTLRISGGVENSNDRVDKYNNIEPSSNSIGSATVETNQVTSFLNENVLTYNKSFGIHDFTATAGFTYQDYLSTGLSGSGIGFLSDVINTGNLAGASTPGIPGSYYSKWTLLSYLARINYTYNDKYLLTVSIRRDGSSRYSKDNQYANFPSAALAWRVSNEEFFRPSKAISDVKLRVSYGATGSTAISPYQTLNQLSSGNVIFGDALYTALAPGTTLPGNLKWETTNQFDAGLDASFLDNRIRFSADYYIKKTKNLLNKVQLPASMGYQNTLQNVGEIENKGLELAVDADVVKSAVNWTVSANISFNRNKVLKLYEGQDIYGSNIYTGSLNDYVNLLREGQPLGIFYGYQEKGYTSTGNLEYVDRSGNGSISADDKTYIGNPNPDFIYGFNSVAGYKGFELTVFIQGSQGNDIFNLNKSSALDLGMGLNLPQEVYYDHWTASKTDAKYPKITRNLAGNMSSRFVEDGSYLRFKNIQIAYNLPLAKMKAKWIKTAQLYASGQNLITITNYSWYDPEINAYGSANSFTQGIDYYTYPASKSVTVGFRCSF